VVVDRVRAPAPLVGDWSLEATGQARDLDPDRWDRKVLLVESRASPP
jgi:hypothetical protein